MLKKISKLFSVSWGSLRSRFDQWHSDGPHAWLFDNENDKLNLNPDAIGFDIGSILEDKECKTPFTSMYLDYLNVNTISLKRLLMMVSVANY